MANDGNIILGAGSYATIANRSANILGAAALTLVQNADADDAHVTIALPFTVTLAGNTYSSVAVGSNGYLTFGGSSDAYASLGPTNPPLPAIHICAADRSFQRVYAGTEGATFRIRYEGSSNTTGTLGSPTVVWEVTFSSINTSTILIDMDANAADGTGTSGVTDGAQYIAVFADGTASTGYDLVSFADAFTLSAKGYNGDYGESSLEVFTLSGTLEEVAAPVTIDGDAALAPFTLAATSIDGIAFGATALDPYTLAATGLNGSAASGDCTLLLFDVAGDTGTAADLAFGTYTLAATGVTGTLADGAILLSAADADGVMYENTSADGAAAFELFTVAGASTFGSVSDGSITLRLITADATGMTGSLMGGEITVPLLTIDANGYSEVIGSATVMLAPPTVDGVLVSTIAAPVFTSIVVNTRTNAVTNYDAVEFNSLCQFSGVVLAATSDGLVALTGSTDNGTGIAAYLKTGPSDFSNPQVKRVEAGYVGYRADGNLELTMITDERLTHTYALAPRQAELHPSRTIFGRGVAGRFWQWKLANVAGADFALDDLSLDVAPVARRT